MLSEHLNYFKSLKAESSRITYYGGYPDVKSKVLIKFQPFKDGVHLKNAFNDKVLFTLYTKFIKSIEFGTDGILFFNVKKEDKDLKVAIKSESKNAFQYFTDIKYHLEEIWEEGKTNPMAFEEIIQFNYKHEKESQNRTAIWILVVFVVVAGFYFLVNKSGSSSNPCAISSDFIKADLNYPDEASFSVFDCNSTENSDGSFTVLQKVKAKNAFGMEKSYIYKLKLRYNGGDKLDQSNWTLESKRSEAVR